MISIITATYNKLEITRAFLASLIQNPPAEPWELIWVDDGSTDGTREWLQSSSSDRHKVLFNERNLGYAVSNNRGAAAARGDVLGFLNNDLVLTAGWFEPMRAALDSARDVGVVGNIQIAVATGRLDHAGMGFDLVGRTIHPHKDFVPTAIRGEGAWCRAVTAACWLVRRPVYEQAGGFDPAFRNGYEDADLCLRLGARGFRHWVSYRSRVYHHVSSSPGRRAHDAQNQALFLRRWGKLASRYGRDDWPSYYLRHLRRHPSQVNAVKLGDALMRVARLRCGESDWAVRKRDELSRAP